MEIRKEWVTPSSALFPPISTFSSIRESQWACIHWLNYSAVDLNRKICERDPGQVVQLVRASSQCAKVAGLISGQGVYKKQAMNA